MAEFKEELPTNQTENDPRASNDKYAALDVSTSRKGLLSDDKLSVGKQNALKAIPGRLNILKFSSNGGLSSPSTKFKQMAEERDEISRSVPSSTRQGYREHFNRFTTQKIDWESLWSICKNWIKNPFNMVLFFMDKLCRSLGSNPFSCNDRNVGRCPTKEITERCMV